MIYFPFIRGRQYDLLALKECLDKELLSDKIIPIIERHLQGTIVRSGSSRTHVLAITLKIMAKNMLL